VTIFFWYTNKANIYLYTQGTADGFQDSYHRAS